MRLFRNTRNRIFELNYYDILSRHLLLQEEKIERVVRESFFFFLVREMIVCYEMMNL